MENYPEIERLKQKQVLQIVSSSFYKELVKYGINKSDIVSVSMNLLDYITEHQHDLENEDDYFDFATQNVINNWTKDKSLAMDNIAIRPLNPDMLVELLSWLSDPDLKKTLISLMPNDLRLLKQYFFETKANFYFGVFYLDSLIGFIGAENINQRFHKLEMRKLIGKSELRSKGFGKIATFLFLFYAFKILDINKVYIHSIDTNIKNINLNSRFGFDLEGMLYKDVYIEDGYHDVLRMSLLKDKWLKLFD